MALDRRFIRRLAGLLKARLPELKLHQVADPRHRRGRRWKSLATLLRLPLCAIMAGCKSLQQVEALSAEMSPAMRRLLGIGRRVPDTTLRTTLCRIHPDALRQALVRQVRAAHRRKALQPQSLPFGVVAIDGKATAISSWDPHYAQKQVHSAGPGASGIVRTLTASLCTSAANVCLDASPIPAQTNEMGHLPTALAELHHAYGSLSLFKLLSCDAGLCSEHNARLIVEQYGLHYLFGLKADQPTLFDEAKRLLSRRTPSQALAQTVDVVSGTTVTRSLHITSDMAGFHWDHSQTVLRVQSVKRCNRTELLIHRENRYFICSLQSQALSAQQWLWVVRNHWAVENHCHWTWDAIFAEDDHPWITSGDRAPQGALAVMLLRRIAYNMLALFRSVTQRAEDRRQTPWRDLLRALYITLIAAQPLDIERLRPRKLRAATVG